MNRQDTDRAFKQVHGHISKLREEQQDQAVKIAGMQEAGRQALKSIGTLTYRSDTAERRMDGIETRLCLVAIVISLLTGFVGGVLSNPVLAFIDEIRRKAIECPISNPNCKSLPYAAQPKESGKLP